MRILLTGASGFIGRYLVDYFKGNQIVKTVGRSNICQYKYNLALEVPAFNELFDVAIHAAGRAHLIPRTLKDVDDFFKVNYQGTMNLLRALEGYPPYAFIFISTVAVYGLQQGNQINENYPLLATDPYGLSKIQAEQLIQDWCNKYDVICTILRLPLVVGPNPTGTLHAMIKGIQKGYYFNIDGGKKQKSMVLVDDVANYILKVKEIGGIYNLTDGYHPTFYELSQLIALQLDKSKVLNMPLKLAKIIAKMGDLVGKYAPLNTEKLNKITSTLTFDDSKARATFGWNPTPVLKGFNIS